VVPPSTVPSPPAFVQPGSPVTSPSPFIQQTPVPQQQIYQPPGGPQPIQAPTPQLQQQYGVMTPPPQ
jgi:hypothetical protein